ncbi:hypothetical protein PR048_032080 [Dryococelus australis]|uniref:Uncharacterized protein n=1 Tax=Dryococelus australis TaxID=614101 RepID=A0ABQ9G2E0_9NEOP|nr:hypothetical protein PR048_032080 [Dryococelus australis]
MGASSIDEYEITVLRIMDATDTLLIHPEPGRDPFPSERCGLASEHTTCLLRGPHWCSTYLCADDVGTVTAPDHVGVVHGTRGNLRNRRGRFWGHLRSTISHLISFMDQERSFRGHLQSRWGRLWVVCGAEGVICEAGGVERLWIIWNYFRVIMEQVEQLWSDCGAHEAYCGGGLLGIGMTLNAIDFFRWHIYSSAAIDFFRWNIYSSAAIDFFRWHIYSSAAIDEFVKASLLLLRLDIKRDDRLKSQKNNCKGRVNTDKKRPVLAVADTTSNGFYLKQSSSKGTLKHYCTYEKPQALVEAISCRACKTAIQAVYNVDSIPGAVEALTESFAVKNNSIWLRSLASVLKSRQYHNVLTNELLQLLQDMQLNLRINKHMASTRWHPAVFPRSCSKTPHTCVYSTPVENSDALVGRIYAVCNVLLTTPVIIEMSDSQCIGVVTVRENGSTPRKPADQRHHPARYQLAKIDPVETPPRIESGSTGWEASSLTTTPPRSLKHFEKYGVRLSVETHRDENIKMQLDVPLGAFQHNTQPPASGPGRREIPEKTRRLAAPSGTTATCDNQGTARLGIEPSWPMEGLLFEEAIFLLQKIELCFSSPPPPSTTGWRTSERFQALIYTEERARGRALSGGYYWQRVQPSTLWHLPYAPPLFLPPP